MKTIATHLKDLSLLNVAVYFFVFAVCAKGVVYFAGQHPPKEALLSAQGTVTAVNLGGQGNATSLELASEQGPQRYSSYFGIVWPGMQSIAVGDYVEMLVERDRTNKNEMFTGKRYYFWELVHQGEIVVDYEEVGQMVGNKEATVDRYVDYWLVAGCIFLIIAYMRKTILMRKSKGQ